MLICRRHKVAYDVLLVLSSPARKRFTLGSRKCLCQFVGNTGSLADDGYNEPAPISSVKCRFDGTVGWQIQDGTSTIAHRPT